MKKFILLLFINSAMIFSLHAQKVTDYTYRLDNGINVKIELGWNHVWASQTFEPLKPPDKVMLVPTVRTLGNLISGSSFKVYSGGKEVRIQDLKPGTCSLKESFKLTGKPGTISFTVDEVTIKPQTKTTLTIVVYDYQISMEEKPESHGGQAIFASKIERFKGNTEQNSSCGVVLFYEKGKHDKPVSPADGKAIKTGTIKPGTYDALITLGAADRPQKVWLENFTVKPDISYNITTNLNAGIIEYLGGNKDVKALHLYPAGTSARQTGTPAPDKTLEIMKCEAQGTTSPCPPGTYDVLLDYNGKKYEWRKNIAVSTGSRAQIK
ncbi:MAG: hypothetical protein Q8868_13970 [Bacteroidota bacterium]|nr:hypothetical protein [Bacteroidota bacterium]